MQKTKIMASSLITSWQIDVETVANFILLGSKITPDGDCNHEIKRHTLEGNSILKNCKYLQIALTSVGILITFILPINKHRVFSHLKKKL